MIRNYEATAIVTDDAPTAYLRLSIDDVSHEEIVSAAMHYFMENGYEQTTLAAVAHRLGLSETTIYSYFPDKRELFRAIIQYCYDKVGMPHSLLSEANLSAKEALTKTAQHFISCIYKTESILLIRAVQAEAMCSPEIVLIYFEAGQRPIKSAFAALLREFNRQGQLSVPDPVRAAEQFFCLLTGEMLQKILALPALRPDEAEIEDRIMTTVDLFLAYYRPNDFEKTKALA